jgi:hypothetical protein
VKLRCARHDLHVLLGAAVFQRQVVLRQRANHVQKQASGDDGLAGSGVRGVERHANTQLHVGGLKLGPAVLDAEENACE